MNSRRFALLLVAPLLISPATGGSTARGESLQPIRLPPPPLRLLQPLDREVILKPIAEKEFSWTPVEKAVLYHLEFSTDQEFRVLILDAYPTGNSFTIKELPEGTFYWHVSSLNEEGLEGKFGSAFSFFYPRRAR